MLDIKYSKQPVFNVAWRAEHWAGTQDTCGGGEGGFYFWLCQWPVNWSWSIHLPSLSFKFLNSKMAKMILTALVKALWYLVRRSTDLDQSRALLFLLNQRCRTLAAPSEVRLQASSFVSESQATNRPKSSKHHSPDLHLSTLEEGAYMLSEGAKVLSVFTDSQPNYGFGC